MKTYLLSDIVYFLFSLLDRDSIAQEVVGLSFGYNYFPSAELVTPVKVKSKIEQVELHACPQLDWGYGVHLIGGNFSGVFASRTIETILKEIYTLNYE